MKNDTLKHAMLKQLGEKIDYDKTFKQYRRDIEKFEQVGRPTEYDRVALMCVSVWHLSHWRLDVTVDHYMR